MDEVSILSDLLFFFCLFTRFLWAFTVRDTAVQKKLEHLFILHIQTQYVLFLHTFKVTLSVSGFPP